MVRRSSGCCALFPVLALLAGACSNDRPDADGSSGRSWQEDGGAGAAGSLGSVEGRSGSGPGGAVGAGGALGGAPGGGFGAEAGIAPASGGTAAVSSGGTGNTHASAGNGSAAPSPTESGDMVPAELRGSLEAAAHLDGGALASQYALPLESGVGYDPLLASGLSLIQASGVALNEAELDGLARDGFVISTRHQYPTFAYGYKTLYLHDLPVYVSADSILFAVHRSFDEILKEVELSLLISELRALLQGMRSRLLRLELSAPLESDIDTYLSVAKGLLDGELAAPVASADPAEVEALYELARAGAGHRVVRWFGSERDEDFSQFKPRGHYTDTAALGNYFRSMMFLGRVDLRIAETASNGAQVFRREQFDAAVALNELLGPDRERWTKIDEVIGWFVGERDSMSPVELGGMLTKLGVSELAGSAALSDATILDELVRGGWGAQRIASRIIRKGPSVSGVLPLDRSFALFGQRYTVDSHVFVNTTHDRVTNRMMPDPLDVAFAALGNDSALEHLGAALQNSSYAAALGKTRILVDAHESAYWQGSLYTTWLGALRVLSPSAEALTTQPAYLRTRAGQNRILNAQLASWAELRHDTLLYAKQSYTSGAQCEFPDAYVDPYPELYARLGTFAQRMAVIADRLQESPGTLAFAVAVPDAVRAWAENLQATTLYLERMAKNQQSGTPHEQELIDFVNAAVTWVESTSCGGDPIYTHQAGWYLKLFYGGTLGNFNAFKFDPTIADVHTQPTDSAGADVGRILHVATGYPRLMVATVETCHGPRAYAGLVSSFGQTIEENWTRLTDEEWAERLKTAPSEFPDPAWMSGLLDRTAPGASAAAP